MNALIRMMRFFKCTIDYSIMYSGFPAIFEGYSNANWIANLDEKKSTSGYMLLLVGVILLRNLLNKLLLSSPLWSLSLLP